jgi:hypothetical protein
MTTKTNPLAVFEECAMRKVPFGDLEIAAAKFEEARAAVAELVEATSSVPSFIASPTTSAEWAAQDEAVGFSDALSGKGIRSCRSAAYESGVAKGKRLRAALAAFQGEGHG